MPELLLCDTLRKRLAAAANDKALDDQLRTALRNAVDSTHSPATIDFSLVLKYWRAVSATGTCNERLHELLEGSQIYEAAYVPPPKPKELVERLKKLEILQAEREYRKMVKNVDIELYDADRLSDIRELKSVKQQAIMCMNLVLSFAGVWAFVYYALHSSVQTQGMRALGATLAALIALVAEIWLFVKAEVFHDAFSKKKEQRKQQKQLQNTIARALEDDAKSISGTKNDSSNSNKKED